MHREAYRFVAGVAGGREWKRKHVLEFGAFDVNSSEQGLNIRPLFDGCTSYTGVDIREGPGVDVVAKAEAYTPEKPVDVVVTTEMLEHHPKPEAVIKQAHAILKPGGLLIITAAAPERAPHGNDGGEVGKEHYQNIDPADLAAWLEVWDDVRIEHNHRAGDVYAVATRPAEQEAAKAEPVKAESTPATDTTEAQAGGKK